MDVIKEVDKLETYLENEYGLSTVMSPASLIKAIHQSRKRGRVDQFLISNEVNEYKKDLKILKRMRKRKDFLTFLSKDGKRLRISGKLKDIGAIEAGKRNGALKIFYDKHINSELIEYRLTGISEIIDSNNRSLVSNLALGLAISVLSISFIMGFVFRSLRMVLITLVVNIAPLIMIAGLIGWFGYHLTVSTSIIFTIAFGIAVDDSIHILSRYKIYQSYFDDKYTALRESFIQSGKAILITTFIISAGFMALMFSDFKSIAQTGLFVSLCLLFALILDLLLLPAILVKVFGIKKLND
jgi:predicted RND superfamily exporter protein